MATDCLDRLRGLATRLHLRHESPYIGRMREISDLHEFGVAIYRQRMHREHPQATEDELDELVRAWLAEPPRGGRLRRPERRTDDAS